VLAAQAAREPHLQPQQLSAALELTAVRATAAARGVKLERRRAVGRLLTHLTRGGSSRKPPVRASVCSHKPQHSHSRLTRGPRTRRVARVGPRLAERSARSAQEPPRHVTAARAALSLRPKVLRQLLRAAGERVRTGAATRYGEPAGVTRHEALPRRRTSRITAGRQASPCQAQLQREEAAICPKLPVQSPHDALLYLQGLKLQGLKLFRVSRLLF
jgi:hypothetical protein